MKLFGVSLGYSQGRRKRIIGNFKGGLSKIDINPYVTYWVVEGLSGRSPKYEEESDLGRRKVVSRASHGKNTVGWDNLSSGRVTQGMNRLQ